MKGKFLRWLLVGIFVVTLAGLSIAQDETPGVTEETIKLGSFIAQSGPVAPIGIPVVHGAQTWYNFVNDEWDGIYGRKIEFIALDDGFDPARTVAVVKKLVEQEGVFAIVNPLGTPTFLAAYDYLVQQGVPVVSPHGNAVLMCEPTVHNIFSIQPNNIAFARTLAQYAVERLGAKEKKIAAVYIDNAFGNELRDYFVPELEENGIEPVEIPYPADETDFSPYVLQLRQAGVEIAVLLGTIVDGASILREAETLDYNPEWLGTNTLTDLALFQLAGTTAAEGLIATGFALDPSTPYNAAAYVFRELLERYFPGEIPSGFSEIAYVGAQMVVDALYLAGPNLTREKFIAALEGFDDWEQGLTPPVTYSADDHCGIENLWLIRAHDGTFEFVEEWQLQD